MKKGGGKEERSDRTAAVRGGRRWQREGVVTPQQPQGSGGYEATEGDDDDDSHCHGDEGDAGDDGGAGHSDGHGFWVGLTTHLTPVFTVKRS